MRAGFSLALFSLCCGLAAAEPTADEVWQLVREASALYESMDGVEYEVVLKSPELEGLLASKSKGLAGTPKIVYRRRNLANSVTVALPEVPEMLRATAEAGLAGEIEKIESLRIMRDLGWTLFASFLRWVEAGERYDVLEWKPAEALVEFNELSEPLMGRSMRSCRLRFDRRRSTIDQLALWFGGTVELTIAVTYEKAGFFPGTKMPLVESIVFRHAGLRGPATVSLRVQEGKYERSAASQADDLSTSRRALLRRAGFNRHQIERAQVDAEGNIALNLSRSPIDALPPLHGLPVTSLNLADTRIADLSPLAGLPLRSLVLDRTPVRDLRPLAGMKLEHLSLAGVRLSDLRLLAAMPLIRLSLAGVSDDFDLSLLRRMKLEALDLEQRPVADLSPLQGMPLRELVLNRTKVRDLTPLQGMPLTLLECAGTPLADLSPLAQCRELSTLLIHGTKVESLRPLAGLRLLDLRIGETPVRDLSPLRRMPLRTFAGHGGSATDASPLAECPDLEHITLPRSAANVEALRGLTKLRELSFGWDPQKQGPTQSTESFWKEFDLATARRAAAP